jgi:hypothetical protein
LVFRFDTVHESFTSFWERKVHFVGLEFKITLAFSEGIFFFTQVLGALFEGILLKTSFSLHKSVRDFFKLTTVIIDLVLETKVVVLQFFIVIALLGVEVVKLGLVSVVDVLDLLLVTLELILHLTLLSEQVIEGGLLLIVLVLNVHIQSFDVIGLGITSVFVQSQVVIGELTFVLADIFDEGLVLTLEVEVSGVVLVDVFDLLLHLGDFSHDFTVFALQKVIEISAVINLAARAGLLSRDSRNTVIGHGSINSVDLCVVTNSSVVNFTHSSSAHTGGSSNTCTSHLHASGTSSKSLVSHSNVLNLNLIND